jgi:S-adenosylmethionine-diacylglycerol 3-amino-3-carboxypropyl transferase
MKMAQVLDLPCPTKRNWLERAVFHGIVFNMSWEDPEMDRRALQITPDDTVISITSAGCNPLNLLCQGPRKLISIDSNPAQTAVLELKLAGLATLDYETFFDIFAARRPQRVNDVYASRLRGELSPRSRAFWDHNLKLVARGLYNYGRMGLFCRILRRFLALLGIPMARADEFFESRSLEAQQAWYDANVAPRLWGGFHARLVKMFVNSRPLMYMAGVHPRQFDLVDQRHDMYDYIRERVEYALTKVPIYDNYF